MPPESGESPHVRDEESETVESETDEQWDSQPPEDHDPSPPTDPSAPDTGVGGVSGDPSEVLTDRALAFVVDLVVLGVVSAVIWTFSFFLIFILRMLMGIITDSGFISLLIGWFGRTVLWALIAVAIVGYFVMLDARSSGSLGKRIFDLTVVRKDGSPVDDMDVVKRSSVFVVIAVVAGLPHIPFSFLALPWVGFVVVAGLAAEAVAMFVRDGERLGDTLAETKVISKK